MALKYNPVTGKVQDDGLGLQTRQIPSAITSAVLGAAGAPVSAAFDATRTGLTDLFGGDPNTLPGGPSKFSDASQAARDVGLGNLGMAADNYGQAFSRIGLGLLGAQPAALPQPEGPIVPPLPVPPEDTVLAPLPAAPAIQTPAPVAQPAASAPAVQSVAPVPRAMEPVPTEVQSVQQLDVRPPPQNAGLTFGFGGGNETARQYLDRMDASDQQRVQARRSQVVDSGINRALQTLGRDTATRQERRAARDQLAVLQPLALGLTEVAGNQATQQLGDNAALQRTQLEADANANAAALQAQTQLGVAGLGAEATLGAAGLRANATQQAALTKAALAQNSPESQLSVARAELLRIQQGLALNALNNNDVSGALQAVSGAAPSPLRLLEDDFGNALGTVDAQGNVVVYSDDQLKKNRAASQVAKGFGLQ